MPNQCQPSIPTTIHTQDSAKTFFKEKNLLPLACHVVNNQALYLCAKSKKTREQANRCGAVFLTALWWALLFYSSSDFSSSSHPSQNPRVGLYSARAELFSAIEWADAPRALCEACSSLPAATLWILLLWIFSSSNCEYCYYCEYASTWLAHRWLLQRPSSGFQ